MIQLLAIVKNERHTLARTLESLAPLVDSYTILDTGSTDGTQDLVRAWATHFGILGAVHTRPFVDYAQARNLCWQFAREQTPAEPWHLWADADDVYRGDYELLRAILRSSRADCYDVRQAWPDGTVMVPRLFRASLPWQYRGRVHERVELPGQRYHRAALTSHTYHHTPHPLGQRRSQLRWHRDLVWLARDLAECTTDAEREHVQDHIAATRRWIRELAEKRAGAPSPPS